MELENLILELMRQKKYLPLRIDELSKALAAQGKIFGRLKKLIPRMVRAGKIVRVKHDRYCLPKDAGLVSGKIVFRAGGSAKVFPEASDEASRERPPIYIRAEDTGVALNGDRVVVRIERRSRKSRFREHYAHDDNLEYGSVVEVLERAFSSTTGTLQRTRYAWEVVPDDPRIGLNILVQAPERTSLFPLPKEGDKVVVRLNEWRRRNQAPTGEIEEVLGASHTPFAEYKAILYRYGLSPVFPEAVCKELDFLPERVEESDFSRRKDVRHIFTITIDPDDAKDFDDALSLEFLGEEGLRVGIHIADVSHYVRTGTALDLEARARGNSTYLVGTVIPMLPHQLSSGICSLIENENRLAKSVFVNFDAHGNIVGTEFANTVISSRKRLTYSQAFALMREDDNAKIRSIPPVPEYRSGHPGRAFSDLSDLEIDELRKNVRLLWKLAEGLRRERMQKGGLDLDMPEVKIYVDGEGYAERIVQIEQDESHQLVEEYMLLANEIVARAFSQANLPYISRVHDSPEAEKLEELREELLIAGIEVGDLTKRSEVVKLLDAIKSCEDAYPMRIRFLRSLKQACYRASADGHYGLAKAYYAHFTSPIRRYADLTLHRVFDFYLQKNKLPTSSSRKQAILSPAEQNLVAEHISERERISMEAERESVKIKLLEFFEKEVERKSKQVFEAVITDIRSMGIFVELKISQAFGMIPLSSMSDDLYQISSDGTSIFGRRFHREFCIGQTVPVEVLRVDRFRRTLDFCLAQSALSDEKYAAKKKTKKASRELGNFYRLDFRYKASNSKKSHRGKGARKRHSR